MVLRLGGIRAEFVPSADDAGEWLGRELHDGDVVLLKASRGVKLFPRTLPPKVALPGLFEESPPPHPTTAAKMRTETIRMGIPLARIVARHRGPPEPLNWRGGEPGLRGCARRRAKGPRDRPIA